MLLSAKLSSDQYPDRLSRVIPDIELALYQPLIAQIQALKKQRNAIVLAHNYQRPEIYHGVADVVGDSLKLAQVSATTTADVVIVCGVHFMAETAKLLNPEKLVLSPDLRAGCSLADSINAAQVRQLKQAYPDVPVVSYVNTSAEVKAESDICCTSSNAIDVLKYLDSDRAIFLPDRYLAAYAAQYVDMDLICWTGQCEVHERFSAKDLQLLRHDYADLSILAHPECPPDVQAEADYVGSTGAMVSWVKRERPRRVALITECSMSDNVAIALPDVEFIRPCALCPHMKQIDLHKILRSLQCLSAPVEIDPLIASRARRALGRMLSVNST